MAKKKESERKGPKRAGSYAKSGKKKDAQRLMAFKGRSATVKMLKNTYGMSEEAAKKYIKNEL